MCLSVEIFLLKKKIFLGVKDLGGLFGGLGLLKIKRIYLMSLIICKSLFGRKRIPTPPFMQKCQNEYGSSRVCLFFLSLSLYLPEGLFGEGFHET